jgi:replicative DNA helicase
MTLEAFPADTPADYLINGIIQLLDDGKTAEARVAVAKVDEELFDIPVDRDLFRAIRNALEFSSAPGPLEVRFLIEHDDRGAAPIDEVVSRLLRAQSVAGSASWAMYAHGATRQLRAAHGIRQAKELGRELLAATSRPSPEVCERIIRRARDIQDGIGPGRQAGARALLLIIDQWKQHEAEKLVVTGFDPLDQAFGGGLPVGLHGIAARPGVGKSALALQLVAGALLHDPDARVVWLRAEMTNDLLLSKLLACWSRLRDDQLEPITIKDALRRADTAVPVYRDLAAVVGDRLVVVDPPITPSSIERWIEEVRPSLVVLDYLQQVEAAGFTDKRTEIEHVVQRLSNASTRHELPIVVVSSVAAARTSGPSGIGALTKESNRLDYAAHTFVTLWPQGDDSESTKRVVMRIQKSRTGRIGDEELWFHGPTQFFMPAAAPVHEAFEAWSPR